MRFFRDPESRSSIPRTRDRDFVFRVRSKNPEIPPIPGIGIGIWKSRKNPEVKSPENPEIPGIGIYFFLISGFSSPGFSKFIPGIRDRDFLFWARSKNPENSEIPGIGIGIWKSRKNPEDPAIPGIGIYFFLNFAIFILGIFSKFPEFRICFGILQPVWSDQFSKNY